MTDLYPLTFHPFYKEKIWGGNKIHRILGRDYGNLANSGESWEISGVEGNISVVNSGELKGKSLTDLIDAYQEDLLGKRVHQKFGTHFPLLIKFIDANDDLSIQVHPDDTLAMERHNSFGKTEMWYVLQADTGASLISGFSKTLSKEQYLEYFKSGRLMEILNRESVEEGDVFFLPAGRVHTIGKGILLAEIQQTSDITYRIYDFERKDKQGKPRELHTKEALDALDFNYYPEYKSSYTHTLNEVSEIVKCPYFQTNILQFDKPRDWDLRKRDSFTIIIGIGGKLRIEYEQGSVILNKGETILIPASIRQVKLMPGSGNTCKILETSIPEVD